MASRQKMVVAAARVLAQVRQPGFRVEDKDDLVEVVALLIYRQHLVANNEGIAKLQGKPWARLNRSQQGRYRSLAKAAIEAESAQQT